MKHPDFRKYSAARLFVGLLPAASLLLTGSLTQSAAIAGATGGADPTRTELVANEIRLVELLAGGPLTADERLQVADAVDRGLQGNRTVFLQGSANVAKALRGVSKDSAKLIIVEWAKTPDLWQQEVNTQSIRQQARFNIETLKSQPGLEGSNAIEDAIIHRHDPTVVLDTARQHIISEVNLGLLYDGSAWYAQQVGLPGPSADFKNHLRVFLKGNYLKLNADVAAMLCDEPRNFLYMTGMLGDLKHNEAALRALRTKLESEDPSTRDVLLAVAVSDASRIEQAKVQQLLDRNSQTARQAAGAIGYGNAVNSLYGPGGVLAH